MNRCTISGCLSLLGLLLVTFPVAAETPLKVTLCALKADPGAYNRKLVEVTGFVSHGFEDFSIFDPGCLPWMGIWLEYGGTAKSGTMYCCGVTADHSRPEPLMVENVTIPLVEDKVFHRFDKLIQRQDSVLLHATLVGRFFAGRKDGFLSPERWGGYGHMGCCSLLAIQQVRSVDPADRRDVDYDPFPDDPSIDVGCGYRELTDLLQMDQWIAAQREAEDRQPWAFDDPRRVAAQALVHFVGSSATSAALEETRKAQGRVVYEWKPPRIDLTYMVVVSRPYLVTFYARDPNRIAWIAVAVYESSCERTE